MIDLAFQDRTTEFQACVSSVKIRDSRSSIPSSSRAQASHRQQSSKNEMQAIKSSTKSVFRSEIASSAYSLGMGINEIGKKLQKLAMLAKRRTLFDDHPIEITELTYIIKQDIAVLNLKLADLRTQIDQSKGKSMKQLNDHNLHVLASLQKKLAGTSLSFKDILEIRSENMKSAKSREAKFTLKTDAAQFRKPSTSILQEMKQGNKTPISINEEQNQLILNIDDYSQSKYINDSKYQQMMLLEQNDQYLGERNLAIQSIEKTIGELGSMFTQLMHLVAEQRETVQRIEYDADDISTNVNGVYRELVKFYARLSSNRWLYIKMFGIVLVFFFFFVLFS